MAGRPVRKLSVCCAVSQSGRTICERSVRGSPTAIMIATPITAKAPSWFSKIMREHHEQPSPYRVTGRRPRRLRTLGHLYCAVENRGFATSPQKVGMIKPTFALVLFTSPARRHQQNRPPTSTTHYLNFRLV